jgi:hypothetical protein
LGIFPVLLLAAAVLISGRTKTPPPPPSGGTNGNVQVIDGVLVLKGYTNLPKPTGYTASNCPQPPLLGQPGGAASSLNSDAYTKYYCEATVNAILANWSKTYPISSGATTIKVPGNYGYTITVNYYEPLHKNWTNGKYARGAWSCSGYLNAMGGWTASKVEAYGNGKFLQAQVPEFGID